MPVVARDRGVDREHAPRRRDVRPARRTVSSRFRLPLDASAGVALGEGIDLGDGDAVEVAGDRLLQRARRDGESKRRFRRPLAHEGEDQAGGEAVASADPVHQPHGVVLAVVELARLRVPQDRAPPVVARRHALAQRDRHHGRPELAREPLGHLPIAGQVQLAARDVGVGDVEAEHRLDVLLVGHDDIDVPHQRPHRGLGLGRRPELLAVVQVHAHARAGGLRGLDGLVRARGCAGAESGCDARHVEPGRAVEDSGPVGRPRLHLGDRRVRAVVDHRRGPLAGPSLREVDADPVAAALDELGSHAFGADRLHRRIPDRVPGQPGHEVALEAEVRQADGHVRLATAERRAEHRRLEEALESRRAEPQHDLAEGDDLHDSSQNPAITRTGGSRPATGMDASRSPLPAGRYARAAVTLPTIRLALAVIAA